MIDRHFPSFSPSCSVRFTATPEGRRKLRVLPEYIAEFILQMEAIIQRRAVIQYVGSRRYVNVDASLFYAEEFDESGEPIWDEFPLGDDAKIHRQVGDLVNWIQCQYQVYFVEDDSAAALRRCA